MIDDAKKFVEELLAHVPEDKQAAVRELGAGYLRQSDYSRRQDELKTQQDAVADYYAQLTDWYEQNKARLTPAPTPDPSPTPTPTPTPAFQTPATGLTREDFQKELDKALGTASQQAIAAIVHTNELSVKHFATFKEPLNIQALMADPEIGKLGLLGVYDKTYKPKYDELAKQAEDQRIEAEVQKRLTEARKAQLPYPVPGREPSPLDAIEAAILHPPDPAKPVTPPVQGDQVLLEAVAAYEAAQMKAGAGV